MKNNVYLFTFQNKIFIIKIIQMKIPNEMANIKN